MTLQEKHVRIIAINDINSELDDKEIESWIRLTRVLTHEIMNSVTHGVGCLLGIAGLVLLIVFAALRGGGPAHMAAAIVYGVSIILEYLASTLYHAIQPAGAKTRVPHYRPQLHLPAHSRQLYAVLPHTLATTAALCCSLPCGPSPSSASPSSVYA